jgi:hypothetical protein
MDKTCIEQDFQMLGNGRARDGKAGGQFVDGFRSTPQLFKEMPPVGIRNGHERIGRDHRLLWIKSAAISTVLSNAALVRWRSRIEQTRLRGKRTFGGKRLERFAILDGDGCAAGDAQHRVACKREMR